MLHHVAALKVVEATGDVVRASEDAERPALMAA
jgi:hypothetical protein